MEEESTSQCGDLQSSTFYPVVWVQVRNGKPIKSTVTGQLILGQQEKYPDGGYLLWSDLTARHHASSATYFLEYASMAVITREEYAHMCFSCI